MMLQKRMADGDAEEDGRCCKGGWMMLQRRMADVAEMAVEYLCSRCFSWLPLHPTECSQDSRCRSSGLPLAGRCHVDKADISARLCCKSDPTDISL